MNIEQLIDQISNDTGIYFYKFEQDKDVIVAKSHFFDFRFGPTYLEIVDSSVLPGPNLKNYLQEVLPFRIDFIVDNYYDIVVDEMNNIHHCCIGAEHQDEWNEKE